MEQLCGLVARNYTDQPVVFRLKRKPDTVLLEYGIAARWVNPRQSWWERLLGRALVSGPGMFFWSGEMWPLCAERREDFYREPTEGIEVELGWARVANVG